MKKIPSDPYDGLSRRERQIMMILYGLGSATADDVWKRLPDPPSYSSVRSALALLEESGTVRHERHGRRYVYFPVRPHDAVRSQALDQLITTFFRGSAAGAAAALMDRAEAVNEAEYRELKKLLDELRAQGKH
jgi:BlaI family transcriptional regulator, penicillinase repressor